MTPASTHNDEDLLYKPDSSCKRKTLVGPWKNVAEFHKVYVWLFDASANRETRIKAVSLLRVWSLRRSNLCPAAVLATIVILEAQLKDDAFDLQILPQLQTLYASAFTRFFNFMSSIMQTHNMRTMYETAWQLGLQSFVVDLRHICAHGQMLPPLDVLRNTADYCMRWLHEYYWSDQRANMCDVDASNIRRKEKTHFDANVSQLFAIYDSALECYMKGARNIKTAKRHLHGKRFAYMKGYCEENNIQATLRDAFDTIVKDLAALVKREVAIKDLPEIYIGALMKMNFFFTVGEMRSRDKEFEMLIEVTQSLFRMLAAYGFIEDLFHSLLELADNTIADTTMRAGASFWAIEIVSGFVAFRKCKQMYKAELDENPNIKEFNFTTLNLENISKKVRKLLIYSAIDLKRTLIFGDSLRRPWVWVFERSFVEERMEKINEYTAPVLKSLLPLTEPAIALEEMKALIELIDAAFEMKVGESEICGNSHKRNASSIYTPIDLVRSIQMNSSIDAEMDEETSNAAEVQFGIWNIVPDEETYDWTSCPLGRLPWE